MPIPSRRKEEKPNDFMSRCMGDDKLKKEFPDKKQRTAVCMSKASESLDYMEAADFHHSYDTDSLEEDINNMTVAAYLYENPRTGEIFTYDRQGVHKKDGVFLVYKGKTNE
tara:strand:+ start:213 stop:545 length:333 start_codon:yes stop_codon:yes gene_type:complete